MAEQRHHRLTLLRHGQSAGNRGLIRQGQLEFPLTDLGRSQVRALLDHWRELGRAFDLILSSPLERALATATILGKGLNVPIEEDPDWTEMHGGVAEGHAVEDQAQFLDRTAHAPVYEPLFPDGESLVDLHLRSLKAIQSILYRPRGSYLVVAHGGILNAAVRSVLGLAPSGAPPSASFQFNNTGYMDLAFSPDTLTWRIHRSNICTHLERSGLE